MIRWNAVRAMLATLALCACCLTSAAAQEAAPRSAPCSAAEYHPFDVWVGGWDLTKPDGKPAGTNKVTRPLGSCVLQEHW